MKGRIRAMVAAAVSLGACGRIDTGNIRGDAGGSSTASSSGGDGSSSGNVGSGGSSSGSLGGGDSGSGDSGSGDSGSGDSGSGDSGSGDSGSGDSGSGDSGSGADGSTDGPVSCDGGLVSCGGMCLDTQTDPNNCGGCGVLCTGGTCARGICDLLNRCDAGLLRAACIGIDQQNVYGANGSPANNGGEVYKVPLAGGCPQTLAANQASPHGIVSDGTSVFWTAKDSGEIWTSDTNGGNAQPIVSGQTGPFNIAVDPKGVYWNTTAGSVWRADKDGRNATQLYGGAPLPWPGYVAVDATRVYFADFVAGTILAADKTGSGAAVPLALRQTQPYGVAVTTKTLFWTEPGSNMVMARDLGPNTTLKILAMNRDSPSGIVTDGTSVYWADSHGSGELSGSIVRAPVGGGATTMLASAQSYPDCIAVDSTSVYWVHASFVISKTAK